MPAATQFCVALENKPGTLAELCTQLAAKAVNIQALMTSDAHGWGTARLVVNHPVAARRVFDAASFQYTEESVWLLRLSDKPGALGRATRKLAEHGVNIDYAYGSIARGSNKVAIVLAISDLKKAAKYLK